MRTLCTARRLGLGCTGGFSSRRRLALLREAWEALWRGQTGEAWCRFHDSPLAVSQSLLFGLARGAHRRLRLERTPQYSSRSPRRTYWLRWSKTSPHTAHQRALLERLFSHPKVRSHDSSTVSATRATTSLGCGIRSATAASVGARIRPNRQ